MSNRSDAGSDKDARTGGGKQCSRRKHHLKGGDLMRTMTSDKQFTELRCSACGKTLYGCKWCATTHSESGGKKWYFARPLQHFGSKSCSNNEGKKRKRVDDDASRPTTERRILTEREDSNATRVIHAYTMAQSAHQHATVLHDFLRWSNEILHANVENFLSNRKPTEIKDDSWEDEDCMKELLTDVSKALEKSRLRRSTGGSIQLIQAWDKTINKSHDRGGNFVLVVITGPVKVYVGTEANRVHGGDNEYVENEENNGAADNTMKMMYSDNGRRVNYLGPRCAFYLPGGCDWSYSIGVNGAVLLMGVDSLNKDFNK